ncbi:hypothetical protein [Streptomyces hypolithicus]
MSHQQPNPYDSYDPSDPYEGHQEQQPAEPLTQTWEGQTWDTQYQPVQPQAPQPQSYEPQPYEPQQPYDPQQPAYGQQAERYQYQYQYEPPPQPSAADTTYLPPQNGAHPLPPETAGHAASAASAAHEPAPGPAAVPAPDPPVPSPALLDSEAYGSPTTLGNARVTDAQRARAEGRSPIIAPGMQPAALTALLALLLAGAAAVGPYALVAPLVLLQAVTAAGWFRLNGMWPARQGIAFAFLGGVTADIALLAVDAAHAPAAIIGTLGVWVVLALVLQLRNRAPADERMYGLTATITSAALAVLAAGHLAAVSAAVTVGAAAVAVAVLTRALPLPGVPSVVVSLLAATGAGIAAGGLTDIGPEGALLGLVAGGCALIGLRVASYDYPSRFVHMTAGVALPLTVAAPAVYLIGRVIA